MIGGLRSTGEAVPQSYLTRLDSLEIGKFKLSRPPILLIKPQTAGTPAEPGSPGLLGQDVLKQFILTVDLPNERLYLRPDPNYHPDPLRYTAVGIQVQRRGTAFFVASVWEGSPASEADIRLGDEIFKIDGKPLSSGALRAPSVHLLHRPEGAKIHLLLRRDSRTFERVLVCRNLLP